MGRRAAALDRNRGETTCDSDRSARSARPSDLRASRASRRSACRWSDAAKDRTTAQKSHVSAATYIVQLADEPVVAYEGGIAGYKATKPAKGKQDRPEQPQRRQKYAAYLDGKHAEALRQVGAEKFYDYRYTFNGFAAKLTEAAGREARRRRPGVVSVTKDRLQHPTTSTTPTFLGLDRPGPAWSKLGGVGKAGEDVIVGVVDTGINAKHPSFCDQKDSSPDGLERQAEPRATGRLPGWHGKCQSG